MPAHAHYSGEIAAQLGEFRIKGQKEASDHRPASDSARMDQHEAALLSEGEKWLASEQVLFDATLTEASRAAVDIQQKSIELQATIDHLLSDTTTLSTVEADMSGERQALVTATENRMRAEVDWKHFRANNDITEQAVYPDSHYWHFGVIALLALIESQTPRRVRARGPGAGALRRRQMAPARKKIQIMPVTLAPSITPVIVYVVVASSGDVFGVFKNRVKAVRVAREHRGMSVFMWLVDPGQA